MSRPSADRSPAVSTTPGAAPAPTRPARGPYRRVVLKVSGESLAAPGQLGIDTDELRAIAEEIAQAKLADEGLQMAVVVGGGNIVRGARLAAEGRINQSTADYMGMLGTVINGLALREALEQCGVQSRVMSAITVTAVAESFIRLRALRHMEKGRVIILVAGTGNPFFTTDTCASLRAIELNAEVLLKATKVDGIYSADPRTDRTAVRFEHLTFKDAVDRRLRVMDLTALTMCMEHGLPVCVFDFKTKGNIRRVIAGERIGTLVANE
ncbi:MAG: UMP kinase [Phycisphaeraceae bacterium]|nr:UMP kinase [Phycisphaeraceae bacterium]